MSVGNPVNNYDFGLEINDVVFAHVQGVTPPTVEFTEHKQGNSGNNPDDKTPGKKIVGDMVVEKVVDAENPDNEVWGAFNRVATGIRQQYVGQGFLVEFGVGGVVINRWSLDSIWVKKIESTGHDLRGDNSALLYRNVTFSVGDYDKVQ